MAQVQIKLLFGRATWANFPPQDSAPTKEQLIEEWLPTYMQSTRFVWENLLDPVLFSSVGSSAAGCKEKFGAMPATLKKGWSVWAEVPLTDPPSTYELT